MNIAEQACEDIEEFLLLGHALSTAHNQHASNCERCQGTIFMTKAIETELEDVPVNPAHKPLWIRELHARETRGYRRKRWALGGMLVATAATVLALAGPRLVDHGSSTATPEATADRSTLLDAASAKQAGAVASASRVQLTLGVVDLQGQEVPPAEATRLLRWRLSQTFSDVSIAVAGQTLAVDIRSQADYASLEQQVNSLLESPLGTLAFSISRAGFMPSLCEYVATDKAARESGIGTGLDEWTLEGQGTFEQCYLTAKGATESIGRHRLATYLQGLEGRFQADTVHWFGFGALGEEQVSADLRWRTHYLQAPTPGLEASGIADASVQRKGDTNAPQVLITFREQAAGIFAQLTADNIGRRIVLSLDERVIFDATVSAKVDGGSVLIDVGSQTTEAEEATRELLDRIRTGPLSIQVLSFARIGDGS